MDFALARDSLPAAERKRGSNYPGEYGARLAQQLHLLPCLLGTIVFSSTTEQAMLLRERTDVFLRRAFRRAHQHGYS